MTTEHGELRKEGPYRCNLPARATRPARFPARRDGRATRETRSERSERVSCLSHLRPVSPLSPAPRSIASRRAYGVYE